MMKKHQHAKVGRTPSIRERIEATRRLKAGKKVISAALACTLALTGLPIAALAMADDEPAGTEPIVETAEEAAEQPAIPGLPPAVAQGGITEQDPADEDPADEGPEGDMTQDGATTGGSEREAEEGADELAETGISLESLDGEGDPVEATPAATEEQTAQAWVRPAAGAAIPLAADNGPFVADAKGAYKTYPIMSACTSTFLGTPQGIVAYGAAPAGGLDYAAEEGVAVASIVDPMIDRSGVSSDAGLRDDQKDPGRSYRSSFGARYTFWKAKLLDSATGSCQELGNGITRIDAGDAVTRIRYNASASDGRGSWERTADGITWTPFTVGAATSQLVFYYKQIADLDENVRLANDNSYISADEWANVSNWVKSLRDSVCFLYQLYDENGNKIDVAPSQAYYYSHANDQEIEVLLDARLADKYEVAKVSWDRYQQRMNGGVPYTQMAPGFATPEKFSSLSYEEGAGSFFINISEDACQSGAAGLGHDACTGAREHTGIYVIGIMVRGIESDQSISVKYWGGQPDDAVQLGALTVPVAGSAGYDWAASGYESASAITVTSALSYNGANTEQSIPLTLPETYAGLYDDDPYSRVLEGNVLNLYFKAHTQKASITSEPVEKMYDGTPLLPSEPHATVPAGFTCVLDDDALTGAQVNAGESAPVLDMGKVRIIRDEDGLDVTPIFDIEQDLGAMKVTKRPIIITPADAEKVCGEEDPAFGEPAIELACESDGHPAIVEGDELEASVYRDGDDEEVNRDAAGEVIPYEGVLKVRYEEDPNYEVTTNVADFTIWPKDGDDPADDPNEGDDPSDDPNEGDDPSEDPADDPNGGEGPAGEPVGDPDEGDDPTDGIIGGDLLTNKVILLTSTGNRFASNSLGGAGYRKTYDGQEMYANATAEKPGSTLLYSSDDGNTWSTENPTFTNVGDYTVQIKATHPDCAETEAVEVPMHIVPRPVTIVVDDAAKQYGDDDPAFTGTLPELVNPDDLGTITYARTNADEEVGTYPQVLTARYTHNPNYSVTVSRGTLDISPNSILLNGIMGAGELISDDETPLASMFDAPDHSCWVHWWIILGMVLTVLASAAAVVRRTLCTKRINDLFRDLEQDGADGAHIR